MYLDMTTFLPQIFASPFGRHFDVRHYNCNDAFQTGTGVSDNRKSSHLATVNSPRTTSLTSTKSAITSHTNRNNENSCPQHPENFAHVSRPSWKQEFIHRSVIRAQNTTIQDKGLSKNGIEPVSSKLNAASHNTPSVAPRTQYRYPYSLAALPATSSEPQKHSTAYRQSQHRNSESPLHNNGGYINSGSKTNRKGLIFEDCQIQHNGNLSSYHRGKRLFDDLNAVDHGQRCSDGSSDFVHTIKTASMSNGSFSMIPKSLCMGRSTDSSGFLSSNVRYSVDSERPLTNASLDDAAMHRSMKRRHIIDELILTEESYVADLKALVYLHSTLLASVNSVSESVRESIRRNIGNLLQTHEDIVQQLHHASFRAAARKWADTTIPARLGYLKRNKISRSEGEARESHFRTHRHTRSSVDAAEVARAHVSLGTSDPDDILDIVRVFKATMPQLFSYEEYCANHELIAHELQKHLQQVWSAYESGIESLAKNVLAIEKKDEHKRKGLTVADLLIKPIQRICKYPLMFHDLLVQTPVADSPTAHAELDALIQRFRDLVRVINIATDNHEARADVQRKWLLQDRLDLSGVGITFEEFRSLGIIQLCGILHVTYQSSKQVDGHFALCVLFNDHFLVASAVPGSGKFQVIAVISLEDMILQSATDGQGLQCPSAFYTWKVCFAEQDVLHEFILSACSKIEEDQWYSGLQRKLCPDSQFWSLGSSLQTVTTLDWKSVGVAYTSQRSLSRESSIQRAATVNNRAAIFQVIIRNTHNAQDLQEYRAPSIAAINRSQSHLSNRRIPVIEARRSERARMEASISDIWTKARLPYPGMIGSKGGQIIRASAGSLARKLSLASIQAPFSRGRTSSLTLSSKKSYEILNESKATIKVGKTSLGSKTGIRKRPTNVPEVDDMRSVVERMIDGGTIGARSEVSLPRQNTLKRGRTQRNQLSVTRDLGTEDSAGRFYCVDNMAIDRSVETEFEENGCDTRDSHMAKDVHVAFRRRKRWSNPMSMLRGWGSEARSIFYVGK